MVLWAFRGRPVRFADAQVGWGAANREPLEPERIAPTRVHRGMRGHERKRLGDGGFRTGRKQPDRASECEGRRRPPRGGVSR